MDPASAYLLTLFIQDDDLKSYEFMKTGDPTEIMSRVAAAVANGRHVRCRIFAGSRERERQYVASKGYSWAATKL